MGNQFIDDKTTSSENPGNAGGSFVEHALEFQTLASLMLDKLSDISNRSIEGEKAALPPERSWLGDVSDLVARAEANESTFPR